MLLPCHRGSNSCSVRFSLEQYFWIKAMLRKAWSCERCITLPRLEPKRRSNLVADCSWMATIQCCQWENIL
jgi:hypothetical protein